MTPLTRESVTWQRRFAAAATAVTLLVAAAAGGVGAGEAPAAAPPPSGAAAAQALSAQWDAAGLLYVGHGVRIPLNGWVEPLPEADAALASPRCNIDRQPKITRSQFLAEYYDRKPVILGGAPDERLNLTTSHLRAYFSRVSLPPRIASSAWHRARRIGRIASSASHRAHGIERIASGASH